MWKITCVQALHVRMICIMDMPRRCVCMCVCAHVEVHPARRLVKRICYSTGNNAGTKWCLWIYVMRACKHPYRCICESCTSNLYPSLGTTRMWKQKVQRRTLAPQFLAKERSAKMYSSQALGFVRMRFKSPPGFTRGARRFCLGRRAAGRSGCTVLDLKRNPFTTRNKA